MEIGPVEKSIYKTRQEHPIVIPQFDPSNFTLESVKGLFSEIKDIGIEHIAIGGSILDMDTYKSMVDMAVNDYDLSAILYITTSGFGRLVGVAGKTAVYWMSVWNAENEFFSRDALTMNSIAVKQHKFETIPTVYVFDDRGETKTSAWLTRATPVPRDKPYISLSIALAAEYCGFRFYIMAGGSGSKVAPPEEHIELLSEKSNLFLIPTSGIRTLEDAKNMFNAGADAIQVGNLLETDGGIKILKEMVKASLSYPGKNF